MAYREGGKGALLELDISDSEMFDVINDQAVEFANNRAAELVGMKYVDGELVPNPDAEWAITESTREQLRDLVVNALTDGMSVDELKTAIVDSRSFSDMRAEMIARTEIGFAHVQGAIAGWKESGVVAGYEWALGSEHDYEDECDDNDGEYVALGDLFPSGDEAPPLHPNCVCALYPVLLGDEPEGD